MDDKSKTKQDLIKELQSLRQKLSENEASDAHRQHNEHALWKSELFLKRSQEAGHIGSFTLDLRRNQESMQPWISTATMDEIFGIDENYHPRTGETWLNLVVQRDEVRQYFINQVLRKRAPFEMEYQIMRPRDGQLRWILGKGELEFDKEGNPVGMIGTVQDITERKKVEESLRESRNYLNKIINTVADPIFVKDRQHRWVLLNDAACILMGHDRDELIGKSDHDIFPKSEADIFWNNDELVFKTGIENVNEENITDARGMVHIAIIKKTLYTNSQGELFIVACINDITERKNSEADLQDREKMLNDILDGSPIPQFVIGKDHRILKWNRALEEYSGIRAADVVGTDRQWVPFYGEKRPVMADLLIDGAAEKIAQLYGGKYSKSKLVDGAYEATDFFPAVGTKGMWLHFTASVIKDSSGTVVGAVETLEDISDNKDAEEELNKSNDLLRGIIEAAPTAIIGIDLNGKVQSVWNRAAETMFGWSKAEVLGKFLPSIPSDKEDEFRNLREWVQSGKSLHGAEVLRQRRDGTPICLNVYASALFDTAKKIIGYVAVLVDITERKQSEDTLREREEFLSSIVENIPNMIFIKDAGELKFIRFNKAGENLLGQKRENLIGKSDYDFFPAEQADFFTKNDRGVLQRGELFDIPEEPIDTHTGRRILHTKKIPIPDKNGKPAYLLGISEDITERKLAEEEKEKLQSQLVQAQKMEFVGRLAGGVAHDFNNILGVIIGFTEITMMKMGLDDPLRENLSKILDAAKRSSEITRQLLAFARKQVIVPVLMDLNESVEATLKMIRRLIGENIELTWSPGNSPCRIMMDPSQLDQVLLNLCVNARDAISGVGKVNIQTDTVCFDENDCLPHTDVVPGKYVQLSVSDNGCGMDQETQEHIFEPFFTTKGLRKGTGMGLATVYGIVKQNEGFILVSSKLGDGSIFKIYIPMHEVEPSEAEKEAVQDLPHGKGESILIVEDDPMVLEINKIMLKDLGYKVLSANTPGEAIRIAQEYSQEIHLFITDVIMPEMNGKDLVERILIIRPEIKYLYMSGYTANVIAHHGVLKEGVHFIQKPFLQTDLAIKIRNILG